MEKGGEYNNKRFKNIGETEFNAPKSEAVETTTRFEVEVASHGTFDVNIPLKEVLLRHDIDLRFLH